MDPFKILEKSYDKEIAEKVLSTFKEVEQNYILQRWKPSEIDAGHFVESVRRLLELEFKGTYTSFSSNLSNFDKGVLDYYESFKKTHDEAFTILIPRVLYSIYKIRNKRGAGHIAGVSPNEIDATYILYSTKWVLAEIIRQKSQLSFPETKRIVDKIIERKIDLLWNEEDIQRVLNTDTKTNEQVLILLFHKSPRTDSELMEITEYQNQSRFHALLNDLHKKRLIEFKNNGECFISPKGRIEAEKLILKYSV